MFRDKLRKITQRQDLSADETAEVIAEIFSGTVSDALIAAFMAALATKGESFEELAGAARAMRRRATRIQAAGAAVVDTCGTGGDGAGTFNISTTTAFVVAGCGVTVAKHGNRSVSSRCGSADLIEALGVDLTSPPDLVEEALAAVGIGFLYAPLYHGAMKHAAAARREVGIRSIFNMLGPLTNPAGANCQLLGVFAPQLTEMFAEALRLLGSRCALVVHGHDGLDEMSVCAPTRVTELKDGLVRTFDIDPQRYLGRRAAPEEVAGGDPARNAEITRGVLAGQRGACRDVVLLNAAAALMAAGRTDGFEDGLRLAAASIDTGAARGKLEQLVRFTNGRG
jgi:anthranilate phosphoribosyltransferase